MEKATMKEMREEAMRRLALLGVPEKLLRQLRQEFKVKVTNFSGEVSDLEERHERALEVFREEVDNGMPFYITESWHGADMISILYIGYDKESWEHEQFMAKEGYHAIYAINCECAALSELGDGVFCIQNGILWRAG